MKIGIFGTGGVGKAFAKKLTELGHQVMIGTRDVAATKAKIGTASISEFLDKNPDVKLGTFSDASQFGELVINVAKGSNIVELIKSISSKDLSGKILIDISNPLDFSKGMPPSLIPEFSNTNSLGEEIQKMLPDTKVVKTLNTMWNGLMLDPSLIGDGDHINYICGNDPEAKEKVKTLLYQFGWKENSILDLGDITNARATEAVLPIWLRVSGVKKTGAFNFKIVS